jgi:aryl-alcohol dehydrogenase-like predicted oxidoreductase
VPAKNDKDLIMNRRDFIMSLGAGALALGFQHELYASEKPKAASDRISLGPKKISVSRMAIGTGTNGSGKNSNQIRKLGMAGVADLLRAGYDNGVTFWDTADQYGSHPCIKDALKGLPREKVTIITKTEAKTAQEMQADLDRFRKELGTDYIDILLLHCMTDATWNQSRRGAMDVISEAQQKGIIRSKGTSCHTLDALKTAAAEPWVEIDLARLNPKQVAMDGPPGVVIPVLQQMKAQGKGVMGMKVFGAGRLRDRQDEMLQYHLAQNCIDCFTIGMESQAELLDNIRRIPAASTRA